MSGRQRVGFSVPAAFSVLGLSCIVVLPADERQTLLLEISKKATAREWREISARIDKATAEIHSKGYYIGIGMLSPEVNMVGVPFYHAPSRTMMAFNCGGCSPIQTPQKLAKGGRSC